MMDGGIPFFTIGHSNRSIGEFTELLRDVDIHILADIRTVPRSRANPQYAKGEIGIAPFEMGYTPCRQRWHEERPYADAADGQIRGQAGA